MSDNTCAAASAPLEGDCIVLSADLPIAVLSTVSRALRQYYKVVVTTMLPERSRPRLVETLKEGDVWYDLLVMSPKNAHFPENIEYRQREEITDLGLKTVFVGRSS
jgi:hypothetical protein